MMTTKWQFLPRISSPSLGDVIQQEQSSYSSAAGFKRPGKVGARAQRNGAGWCLGHLGEEGR